jgi:hypothetical protein
MDSSVAAGGRCACSWRKSKTVKSSIRIHERRCRRVTFGQEPHPHLRSAWQVCPVGHSALAFKPLTRTVPTLFAAGYAWHARSATQTSLPQAGSQNGTFGVRSLQASLSRMVVHATADVSSEQAKLGSAPTAAPTSSQNGTTTLTAAFMRGKGFHGVFAVRRTVSNCCTIAIGTSLACRPWGSRGDKPINEEH